MMRAVIIKAGEFHRAGYPTSVIERSLRHMGRKTKDDIWMVIADTFESLMQVAPTGLKSLGFGP